MQRAITVGAVKKNMGGIFVTGATGIVGASVVANLLERGEHVVAGVRGEGAALPSEVERRHFDFAAPASELHESLRDVDRLFLMRPPAIADVHTHLFPVIDAALNRGVQQIVFLSLQGVQGNRSTPHHAVEKYLRETGAPYTFLRPNFFMQNFSSTYAEAIRERGEIFVPAGRSHTAFIDARDIGRVAAAVFTEPGHIRSAYTLSGEQSLSYAAVAGIMSEELGRPISYRRPSEREYLGALADAGAPADYIDVQKMIHRVVRMNVSAFPNRSVRRLTGQPAGIFRDFVKDFRRAWEPAAEGTAPRP